jgi:hypothetical protein
MTHWDPAKLAAARARGRAKAEAVARARGLAKARASASSPFRGDRLAIAVAMWEDRFKLHDIRRVTGLAPSVVSELVAAVGLARRARGVYPPAARRATPSIAGVLDALAVPAAVPVSVARRLGISTVSVVAILHRRDELTPTTPATSAPQRRCPSCLAPYTGAECPNCPSA